MLLERNSFVLAVKVKDSSRTGAMLVFATHYASITKCLFSFLFFFLILRQAAVTSAVV